MTQHIGTKCVQAGYRPENGGPRQIPIYQSTTFRYDRGESLGDLFDLNASGYFYSRLQNPTNDFVAAKITALEGGTAGMLTSSGQAAIFFAVFNTASAGDHVVVSSAIYGGAFNLFNTTMRRMGVEYSNLQFSKSSAPGDGPIVMVSAKTEKIGQKETVLESLRSLDYVRYLEDY